MQAPIQKPAYHLLFILFLLMAALGAAGRMFYQRQAQAYLAAAENQLEAVADLKQSQIARWRAERMADANLLHQALLIRTTIGAYLAEPANEAVRRQLLDFMTTFNRYNGFGRLVLLDTNLQVRLAVPEDQGWLGPVATQVGRSALQTNQVQISDLHRSTVSGQANMDYFVPILALDGQTVCGLFMLEVNPNHFLFPHIQGWPVPSTTAETLLVRREGGEVVYLNDLRHKTNTALRLRLALDANPDLPASQVVLGKQVLMQGVDYRGQPVLAALRHIPDSPWHLVAKVDLAEVYAPLRREAWMIALLAAGLMLAAVLGTGMVWRHREFQFARQEIAERKTAEGLLRTEKERYHLLFAEMMTGFALHEIICDAQGNPCDYRFLQVNPAFERLTGLKAEAITGRRVREILPSLEPDWIARFGRVALTGQQVQFEDFNRSLGRYYEVRAYRLEAGKFAALFHDITARKQAEMKLQQYADIAQNMQLGLYVFHLEALDDDRTLRLVAANPASTSRMGLNAQEMLGKTMDELFPNLRAIGLPERYAEVVRAEKAVTFEDLTYGDDRIKKSVFAVKAFPLPNQCLGILFENITARKRGELERERLTQELADKNRELENVIYAASHDLRSPLVNIEGFSRRLEKACDEIAKLAGAAALPDEPRERLGVLTQQQIPKSLSFIRASVTKMNALIGGLLQISRLGRAPIQAQRLEMNAVIDKVLQAAAYQLQKGAASVLQEPLPDCVGDAVLVGQVFSNLVDNALKYRAPERPLRIRISGRTQHHESLYCVEDNGIGIAPKHQQMIWELFHRLDPSGSIPGEGLGLALVQRIVSRHRGRAWVESTPGQGSRFFIALPSHSPEQLVFDPDRKISNTEDRER
jgi:PAS domain S-box-containing protein